MWHSLKQSTIQHLTCVPPLFSSGAHSIGEAHSTTDLLGQCCNCWNFSLFTLVSSRLGLATVHKKGQLARFPTSCIKFLTRTSLQFQWEYWASHEGNKIQLFSIARSCRWRSSVIQLKAHQLTEQMLVIQLLSFTPRARCSVLQHMASRHFSSQKIPSVGVWPMLVNT